jgi:hypothetical protein
MRTELTLVIVGHSVRELRLIFHPVPPHGKRPWWCKKFLVYVRRFDIVPKVAANST